MESDIKRRDFLKQGLLLAGTASVLASGLAPKAAFAQTQGKSVRRADRYEVRSSSRENHSNGQGTKRSLFGSPPTSRSGTTIPRRERAFLQTSETSCRM